MQIPLSQPDITELEIQAVLEVLQGTTLSIGPKIVEFEAAIARLTQRRHAIAVCNGTAGLHCAMLAAGIGPGDEVITTPFSFVASANCILYVGATPVFADIDPITLNLDLEKTAAAITPKTKAIVGVEALGHPGGMPELEALANAHGLTLIEDACEAFGGHVKTSEKHREMRPIGSFGKASVFGFYPNKQITTGEGGVIVTDDDEFAQECRSLRNQGRDGMNWLAHQRLGYNYRLSEINAAMGIAQISRLSHILDSRRRVANDYIERLMTSSHLILPTIDDKTRMSWFVFVVRLNDLFSSDDRDQIMRELRAEGIGCNNYFPPIHLQPYMQQMFKFREGQFPITEHVSARTIALPFFNKMETVQVEQVCQTLERIVENNVVGTLRKRVI